MNISFTISDRTISSICDLIRATVGIAAICFICDKGIQALKEM